MARLDVRFRLLPLARPALAERLLQTEAGTPDEIVLAVHRSRLTWAVACTVSELGPDRQAVRQQERKALGRPTMRFCVRTDEPELIVDLRRCVGQPLPEVAPALIPLLLERHPQRVVISPLGRIEVSQPIGLRDGIPGTPVGPHTHLLPDRLRTGRELAPGRDLPAGYAAAASLFPGPDVMSLWSASDFLPPTG